MKRKYRLCIYIIIVVLVTAAYLFYSRPQTINQYYPYLDFSNCVEISGDYFVAPEEEARFVIGAEETDFREMVNLIQTAEFKRSLRNIFPQGANAHRYNDGDFMWDTIIRFENIGLPDGSMGSGSFLDIHNFFGNITFFANGEYVYCSANNGI